MMKTFKLLFPLIFVTFIFFPLVGKSQGVIQDTSNDTLQLDLMTSIHIALGSSPDMVRSKADLEISKLAYRAASLELYSPQLNLEATVPTYQQSNDEREYYDNNLGANVRSWISTENRQWLGNLNGVQPLPTGGQIRIESAFYQRYYSNDIIANSDDKEEYTASWRLSFSQELLRGNLLKIAKDRAQLSLQSSKLTHNRTHQQLIYRIVDDFYAIVAAERELDITREDLKVSIEAAELARRKFEAGLIPEVEAFQLEVEVAQKQADLSSSSSAFISRLDRFKTSLGLKLDRPIHVYGEPEFKTLDVDLDSSVEIALNKRETLKLSIMGVRQAEYSLADAKRPWKLSGYVSAFYDLEQRDQGYDAVYTSNINDYSTNRGVTFTLSMPIYSGGRKHAQVEQSVISLRKAKYNAEQSKKDIILEVREAVRSLREARNRYEISLRSLDIALSTYEITQNRFENGQVTARVWIEAQLTLKSNRIRALRALIDHNLAVAKYYLVIGEPLLPALEES